MGGEEVIIVIVQLKNKLSLYLVSMYRAMKYLYSPILVLA